MSSFLSHPCHGKCVFEPEDVKNTTTYGFSPELNLKPSERAAKRRRIERHAEIYINGGQLAIESAILRGPFGKGWVSPWQNQGNPEASSLNNRDRSCHERVKKNRRKRVYKKRPQEGTTYSEDGAQVSDHRVRRDRPNSGRLDQTKSKVPKSKGVSTRDKLRTDKGIKQKMPRGEAGATSQEEECDVGMEKENSFQEGKGKITQKIRTNNDCNIAHDMLLAKSKDDVGKIPNDNTESKLANKATSAHSCPLLAIRKPMAPKKLRPACSDDRTLQQDTVKKYMGSTRKAISRIQLEEDICTSATATNIETIMNKRILFNPVDNKDRSLGPKVRNRDDMRFPNSRSPLALRYNELQASYNLDQICSEPAGPESRIKSSSAAFMESRSSPISKPTSANDVRAIRENPLTKEVANECNVVHRASPRYMTFDSPGLSPIFANCSKRNPSTAKHSAQDLVTEKEVVEHVDNKMMHSHGSRNGSPSDHLQPRVEVKEISMQAVEFRTTSDEQTKYKSGAEGLQRGSFYDCQGKMNVSEEDRSVVNIPRRISTNNPSSVEFSTQHALVAAQNAFQNELTRKEHYLVPTEEHEQAHLVLRPDDQEKPITPFANFRANFPGSYSILQPTPQMSTQELFEMVSPLTFSSVAKSAAGKEAYFASSPSKQCADSGRPIATIYPEEKSFSRNTAQSTERKSGTGNIKSPSDRNNVQAGAFVRRKSQGPAFSISPNGLLQEIPEHAQQNDLNVEVEAALDDANSFLQSWDIESELKGISSSIIANRGKGKVCGSS